MESGALGTLVNPEITGVINGTTPSVSVTNTESSSATPFNDHEAGSRRYRDNSQMLRVSLSSAPTKCSSTSSVPQLVESLELAGSLNRVRRSLGSVSQVGGHPLDKTLARLVSD